MFHRWDREHLQMTRRDGTSWLSGSDERAVQEKVAVAAPVIRISREPPSVRLEMLEHTVISAAATTYELNNTKQTRATMQYSANTLKMIKEKQTLFHEMRKASSSSSSSSHVRWQDRPQALIQLLKATSKAVRAEKRDRVEKLLTRAEEAKGAGATRIIHRRAWRRNNKEHEKQSGMRKGEPASEKQKNSTHEPRPFSPAWPRTSRMRRTRLQQRIREHDRPRRSPRTSSTKSKSTSSWWGSPWQ